MTARIHAPSAEAIRRAAARLRDGELVAFPTETVYGLGADASRPDAVRGIFAAKGRPADHPVIVHIAAATELSHWAREVPDAAARLAAAFWPGPLTLILPRTAHVPDVVTGAQDTVGLRVPAHTVAQALLAAFGGGIAAPSANRFGRISPTTAQHVVDDLGDAVAMVLDGGACTVGIESTIVAFAAGAPVLLRPGAIGREEIARVCGRPPQAPDAAVPRVSGTLPSHYAPRTRATLVAPAVMAAAIDASRRRDARVAVLARTLARPRDFAGTWIDAPPGREAYAHDLYANLRALDAAGASAILIESAPANEAWLAVRDRLARACRGEDDDRD